jgi:sortase A
MRTRINWHTNHGMRDISFLRWGRFLSLGVGVVLLGYCCFVILDARFYQSYQSRHFQRAIERMPNSNGDVSAFLLAGETASQPRRMDGPGFAAGGDSALGRIEIRSLGLDVMIMEGTDAKTLSRAVGHISGTALPGQQGNVAIAGHRDTFFSALCNIHEDDEIKLTTLTGSYGYRVDSIMVVEPDNISVLDDSDTSMLTLVTCYPFSFVGPAPRRFVVRAHRVSGEAFESRMRVDKR